MPQPTKHFIIASTLALLLLSGCSGNKDEKNNEEQVFAVPVTINPLERGQISSNYHSTAVLESINDAEVITRVTGIIEQLVVEEGDYVEKGQLIAEIDSRRYQLRLAQADAELASVTQELKRITAMHQKRLVSTERVDKLTYQQQSTKVTRDLAALDLKDSRITAPIAGFIASKLVKQGHFTQGYQKLVHIVDQKSLQAVLHIPEHQLANVALHQIAHLNFNAFPAQSFIAKIRSISPIINPQSGTFKVIMSLDNIGQQLKPGMFAQVALVFSTHSNALKVSSDAIISRDGQQYIYVVENNKAREIPITLGFIEKQLTEISGDIDQGAEIIVSGQHNVKSDTLVKVLNRSTESISATSTTTASR